MFVFDHSDWLENFDQPIKGLQTSEGKIYVGNVLDRIGPRPGRHLIDRISD